MTTRCTPIRCYRLDDEGNTTGDPFPFTFPEMVQTFLDKMRQAEFDRVEALVAEAIALQDFDRIDDLVVADFTWNCPDRDHARRPLSRWSAPFLLIIPEFAFSREGAQAILADLPADLRGLHVDLDGSRAIVPRPAFLDELVKEILGKRGAESLCLVSIDAGSAFFLRSSAERRGVSARILKNRPISARKTLLRRFLRRSSPVRY